MCNAFSAHVLLIITGKGIHSDSGVPVIKPKVIELLKGKMDEPKGKDKLVYW